MLQADAINMGFSGRQLLTDLSLQVSPGEVLVLLGPNGAGKSTLLKLLSGETRASDGDVLLDQRPLHDWSAADRARRLAVLPQQSTLSFPFSVLDVIRMGRSPHQGSSDTSNDAQVILTAMRYCDVEHLMERDFTTLSGGERQLVHLARTLCQIWESSDAQPGYLLLDEPTSALDLAHQHRVLELAHRFSRERGVGVLAILHDLNLASAWADRLCLLHQGRIEAQGTTREVLTAETIAAIYGMPVQIAEGFDHPVVIARARGSVHP